MMMAGRMWQPPPDELDLAHDEVHVWRANLDQPARCIKRLALALDADERARAERLHFEHHRRRFVVAHGVLRMVLGRYLGVEPNRLRFQYGARGKPALAESDDWATLRFNMSHAHELALYAISPSREVGIDVEYVRPLDDMKQLAARCFSAQENQAWQELPEGVQLEAFYHCWTRKEAYIKATGDGLSQPLDQFDVSLVPDEAVRFLYIADAPPGTPKWTLQGLRPAAGYVAALAAPEDDWRLSCWQWAGCGQEENDLGGECG